jgi:RHS repeat-associated protein
MTDITGNIVWKADYEPFGKVNIVFENIENNFRFPGQYYISETGLYYNWWRWYKSEIGRYNEFDPIISSNIKYSYGYNNPIKYRDFKGLDVNWGTCEEICETLCHIGGIVACLYICVHVPSLPGHIICEVFCEYMSYKSCEMICTETCYKENDEERDREREKDKNKRKIKCYD